MTRRRTPLVLAALLGTVGFGLSYGASADEPRAISAFDTTTPETTESGGFGGSETTEPTATTDATEDSVTDSTDDAETTEATDTTEPTDTTELTDTTTADTLPDWEPEPIEWTEIMEGVEEGRVEVPIDYADPDGGTFSIYVTRNLADNPAERIGSLFVNPGGPGFGGSDFATFADQIYGQDLLDHFDIIGFDPRGTGLSEPAIDCVDDYDRYFSGTDITPDDDAEHQEIIDLAEELTDACVENNEEIIQFVGTNNAARDIDSIRRALGEDQISWFGFSYGSEFGGRWATMFPDTVRAAVLDGASDPNADALEGGIQQTEGFENTLALYLADCSNDPGCAFHNDGDAEGAFDALMEKLDAKPIPSEPGRPNVTRGVALQGVVQAMYNDSSWPQLSDALVAAQQGDGSGLLALYDEYFGYDGGGWGNELEAFTVIHCMDEAERFTVDEEDDQAQLFTEVAPRLAPEGTVGSYQCGFFPEPADPRGPITGEDAGPILVCGATGDAATPLSSTRNMAEALEDGRLIVIEADQHTCYGADPCADAIIEDYLVNLTVPPEETEC